MTKAISFAVAGLSSHGGGGARRPRAHVLSSLVGLVVIGASGFVFRGVSHFPSGGAIEDRHRWADTRLARPCRESVEWEAASPALHEACRVRAVTPR